jgi:hypothetical protein
MPPDEREWLPPPEPTSRLWDAFLAGEPSEMGGPGPGPRSRSDDELDPAIAETIRLFHALDDAPAPDAALTERIWQEALARAGVAATVPVRANGHGRPADLATTAELVGAGRRTPLQAGAVRVRAWARDAVREIGIAVLAGAIAGFVVVGGGARLIMRLSAMLAEPAQQGAMTRNGERVGDITLGGTIELMVFCMFFGIAGGLIYALVKPWLPWSGWRRGLVFGVLLTLTFGSVALEGGDNPDYRRFGVPFLNVCLFNLLPIGFGLAIAPLSGWLDRIVPHGLSAATLRGRVARILTFGGLGLISLPVFALLVVGIVGVDAVALALVAFLAIRFAIARWAGCFERPSDLLARPVAFATAYAFLLVPVAVGLIQTLRAAGRILGNG